MMRFYFLVFHLFALARIVCASSVEIKVSSIDCNLKDKIRMPASMQTVAELKRLISRSAKMRVRRCEQELWFKGRMLKDDQQLKKLKLRSVDTIFVIYHQTNLLWAVLRPSPDELMKLGCLLPALVIFGGAMLRFLHMQAGRN